MIIANPDRETIHLPDGEYRVKSRQIVSRPAEETEAQRKARIKAGKPAPIVEYTQVIVGRK